MEVIQQESRYARSIIEASLDPLFVIDLTGKILDINEATEIATDKKREKVIGSDFSIYFTDEERAKNAYQQIFISGLIQNYPLTLIDGKEIPVLCNGTVYKDSNGKALGVVIGIRDDTAQKADKLILANRELVFQNGEKQKRAAELVIADFELDFQKQEKEKREIANRELEAYSD